MLMFCACCLFICTLKRTLRVPDILSISIQIPYCTNVRKLCRYYNIFESISLVMYNVESILLSSCVVWRNNLLIHTMLLDGFILMESFVTPAGNWFSRCFLVFLVSILFPAKKWPRINQIFHFLQLFLKEGSNPSLSFQCRRATTVLVTNIFE